MKYSPSSQRHGAWVRGPGMGTGAGHGCGGFMGHGGHGGMRDGTRGKGTNGPAAARGNEYNY